MPTSFCEAIPTILNILRAEEPKSVLDVGMGFGKYGMLAREVLDVARGRYYRAEWRTRIDGIEAFEGYRTPVHDYVYDRVYYSDVRRICKDLPEYDVVLLVDVLEHFEKDQGHALIRDLLNHATKSLIVSTPLYPEPQQAVLGNAYEMHRSRWTPLDFVDFDFAYNVVPVGRNGAQIYRIFRPNTSYTRCVFDEWVDAVSTYDAPLTVAYLLPHDRLTGGLKMLLEQMKQLRLRGHRVRALRRGSPGQTVLPAWSDAAPDETVLVPEGGSFLDYVSGCDVILAGWMSQIPELSGAPIPVVYWEQGSEWLFGEMGDVVTASALRAYLAYCYAQPCYIAAVSPLVARILYARYGRQARVIPNGVDTASYRPGSPADRRTVLLVGNPYLRFKGFDVALEALRRVWSAGYRFRVIWVCQVPPQIRAADFPIDLVVNPSQQELPGIYRRADLLLFTSWYEGFAMPPLEAMASGLAVVATQCGGISSYAKPGYNALLAEPGDVDSLAFAVAYLLENKAARELLAERGRQTALRFSHQNAAARLEEFLRTVVALHTQRLG